MIKYNKIILILLVLSLFIMPTIHAGEVSIADEKFNIPDGFYEDANRSKFVKDKTGTLIVKVYSNVYTDMIAINVLTPNEGRLVLSENEAGYTNKTFKNKRGIYNEDINEFQYISGNKLVCISAHNMSLLIDVLTE